MYSTCLFCHSALGTNEAVEHFPVGRRLAFDAAKGRLWVVCRKCERWNLTPLEERWEAIEECERLFSNTRLRVSTDNIGLARVAEGLELVRIGAPQRPEMAAWRYGDQFGRRRRKHVALAGAGVAVAAGLVILGPATGIIAGSSWGLFNIMNSLNSAYQQRRVRATLRIPDREELVRIRLKQLNRAALVGSQDDWAVRISYAVKAGDKALAGKSVPWYTYDEREATALLHGEDALRAVGQLLPAINASGAKKDEVQSAVTLIGEVAQPQDLFGRFAGREIPRARRRMQPAPTEPGHVLTNLPKEVRLALEMASHEESERRALEGELGVLEAAWRQAEEIAGIADDMFVSDDTRAKLEQLKAGGDTTTGQR